MKRTKLMKCYAEHKYWIWFWTAIAGAIPIGVALGNFLWQCLDRPWCKHEHLGHVSPYLRLSLVVLAALLIMEGTVKLVGQAYHKIHNTIKN